MKANRLQLLLIPDPPTDAQPHLPPGVRDDGIEVLAMMLVSLVRGMVRTGGGEADDESR